MSAYLIVDVDDLLQRFQDRNMSIDLQELAVGLRGGAALAAGLISADRLKAIAVANWKTRKSGRAVNPESIFKVAGYEIFDVPRRDLLAPNLMTRYFLDDPEPVDELILATTSRDLLPVINLIKKTRNARIRVWGSEDALEGAEFVDEIIFQPLETLLGIQTKKVAVFIDFENIAISLNEQGYVVNLDHLIERMITKAKTYGQVIRLSAYAPWGQRGTLPPMVDAHGREIADDAPSRLMLANIDPVFNLPGKNSADIRIARDVITDSTQAESADVYVIASGDRDFNEVLNVLVQRNKAVVIWGVHGSTSRQLEQHPSITVEYIEDFTELRTHKSLLEIPHVKTPGEEAEVFIPSQWASVVIQFEQAANRLITERITKAALVEQLQEVGAVASESRGKDLVSQAIARGILHEDVEQHIMLNMRHSVVEKTRIIRDSIARRVYNTLQVRNWEYVNYGFLLKGLEMEHELEHPGMNIDDQWRSHWIDFLVREHVLQRELLPHRHNPDDLVPVIKLHDDYQLDEEKTALALRPGLSDETLENWTGISLSELGQNDSSALEMVTRIIVSIEQFTSFRNFSWCPLGSLHRRLRSFDSGMLFQRAVEYLVANEVVNLGEYENPLSEFKTKGISLNAGHPYARGILEERDIIIQQLLNLYNTNTPITRESLRQIAPEYNWDLDLWFSIFETENILNPLPGREGQYSLFRTHHTVQTVAGDHNTV